MPKLVYINVTIKNGSIIGTVNFFYIFVSLEQVKH